MDDRLDTIYKDIYKSVDSIFGEKMVSVILYGSYARGDYNDESDIDVAVIVKLPAEDLHIYQEKLIDVSVRLLWDYEKVISLHEISYDLFTEYKNDLPFYHNIEQEGIKLSA